jgi:hypothetical protein
MKKPANSTVAIAAAIIIAGLAAMIATALP